jgi:hypothetical protein
VQALSASGSALGGTVYLVTDLGVKYQVPSRAALADLGFTAADIRGLPDPLLRMLPSGPALDPKSAADGGTRPPADACGTGGTP